MQLSDASVSDKLSFINSIFHTAEKRKSKNGINLSILQTALIRKKGGWGNTNVPNEIKLLIRLDSSTCFTFMKSTRSLCTLIHIEIVLNVYIFILHYICSGWGNKMSLIKSLHRFCFWHLTSIDFYVVLLSPAPNEVFLHLPQPWYPVDQPSA